MKYSIYSSIFVVVVGAHVLPLLAADITKGDTARWLIVPGVSVGSITQLSTLEDLKNKFGAQNVKETMCVEPEEVRIPCVEIEEDGKVSLELYGGENEKHQPIQWPLKSAHILSTRWHTAEGVHLGSTAEELAHINGGPFLYDVPHPETDEISIIMSWQKGRLEKYANAMTIQLSGFQNITSTTSYYTTQGLSSLADRGFCIASSQGIDWKTYGDTVQALYISLEKKPQTTTSEINEQYVLQNKCKGEVTAGMPVGLSTSPETTDALYEAPNTPNSTPPKSIQRVEASNHQAIDTPKTSKLSINPTQVRVISAQSHVPAACPAIVSFTFRIHVDAPGIIYYRFVRNDHGQNQYQSLSFDQSGQEKEVTTEWHLPVSYEGWEAVQFQGANTYDPKTAPFRLSCSQPSSF